MIFGPDQQGRTLELMRGNRSAVDFIELIVEVLHFWDDLIDRDKVLSDADINDKMFKLLVTLPRNQFYIQNFTVLNPILVNAIMNWHVANRFERTEQPDEYKLRIAYILRSSYVDLITQSALIVGGPEWAVQVGEQIRLYAHKETYEGYLGNLNNEFAARQSAEGGMNVL
jgi:hypothetical protein